MAQDLALKVLLLVDSSQSQKISGFGSVLAGLQSPGGLVAGTFAAVGAAVVGIGAKSVQMAAQYQQAMNSVAALNEQNTQQMAYYDSQLKQLAIDAGVAPLQLTAGLNSVLGASYRGAEAVHVLTLATEDAKIGMTSAAITTDALTNVLRAFNVQSKDVTNANGQMLEAVTLGKSTFEQYATSIVKSASASVQFHVSMQTMNAAWATMTSSGIRAAQASTDYQQSLKVMYGNIGTVVKSLEKNGIAFNETKFNAMSYGDKVVYLNTALQQANEKHVKVTGVTLQAAQAISTISQHIGDYNNNLATLSDKQAMAKKTSDAWAITQSGFNQTMDRAKAFLDVFLISLGQKLLPILTQAVNWFLNLGSTISSVIGWFQQNQTVAYLLIAALAGIGTVIGIMVIPGLITAGIAAVTAFAAWAAGAAAAAIATLAATWPIILIGVIVAAVVFGIIMAVKHWGAIAQWIGGVWHTVTQAIGKAFSWLGSFVHGIWNGIVGVIKGAINGVIDIINGIIGGVNKIHIDVGPVHLGFNIPKIPHLQAGGDIVTSGLALVHRGERVLPAGVVRAGGEARGSVINNYFGPITIVAGGRRGSEVKQLVDDFEKELARRWRTRSNIPVLTSGGVKA